MSSSSEIGTKYFMKISGEWSNYNFKGRQADHPMWQAALETLRLAQGDRSQSNGCMYMSGEMTGC